MLNYKSIKYWNQDETKTRCLLDPNGCINCEVTSRSASTSHAVSSMSVLVRKGTMLPYSIVNSRDCVPKIAGFVIIFISLGFEFPAEFGWSGPVTMLTLAWTLKGIRWQHLLTSLCGASLLQRLNKNMSAVTVGLYFGHGSCGLMWFGNDNKLSFFLLSSHGSEFNKRTLMAFVLAHLHYMCIRLMGLFIRTYFLKLKWQLLTFKNDTYTYFLF